MKNYNYTITWSEEEQLFITKVQGRNLATHGGTPYQSLAKMDKLLKETEHQENKTARLEVATQLELMRNHAPLEGQDNFFIKLVGLLHKTMTDEDIEYLLKDSIPV